MPLVVGLKVRLVAVATPRVGVVKFIFVAAIPLGSVVLQLGTFPELDINTELAAGVITPITFALEAYIIVLIAFVNGYVVVDHCGVVLAPESNNCCAVDVPDKIAKVDAFEYTIPPLDAVKLAAVPPRVNPNCPVHPRVKDAALTNAVVGLPPNVKVTLVSSVFVSAAPVGI
jgi:hypothetical protein